MDLGSAGLTFEVRFVINFKQDVRVAVNLVPKDPAGGFHPGFARAAVDVDAGNSRQHNCFVGRWSGLAF